MYRNIEKKYFLLSDSIDTNLLLLFNFHVTDILDIKVFLVGSGIYGIFVLHLKKYSE